MRGAKELRRFDSERAFINRGLKNSMLGRVFGCFLLVAFSFLDFFFPIVSKHVNYCQSYTKPVHIPHHETRVIKLTYCF